VIYLVEDEQGDLWVISPHHYSLWWLEPLEEYEGADCEYGGAIDHAVFLNMVKRGEYKVVKKMEVN
jgi:hypothetical protein